MDSSRLGAELIDFVGDAQLMFTAPFFPGTDPLGYRPTCAMPGDGVLDPGGRLIARERSLDLFLQGSLTYGNPDIGLLTQFAGTDGFHEALTGLVARAVELPLKLAVTGMLFPDGYGAVAVRIEIPGGWNAEHRERLLEGFGPKGRDAVADGLREALLPALSEMADRCCPDAQGETLLPYFNLTYAASTSHPRAGRATLPDELRPLIYPRSPAPIGSDSPWSDEFFYAGYAFFLLASASPGRTLDQLEFLLLHLDVLYARMDRSATAADQLVRDPSRAEDVAWLTSLERRLRADYHALVRPTFSYDYHVLRMRDAVLSAWDTDRIRERTETLLEMARQAVELHLAEAQARRVSRVNLVVTIVALLSFIASAESAVNLWTKFF